MHADPQPQPQTRQVPRRWRMAPMVAPAVAVGADVPKTVSGSPPPTTPVIFDATFDGSFA